MCKKCQILSMGSAAGDMALFSLRVKSASAIPRAFAVLDTLRVLGIQAVLHSVTHQFALESHIFFCIWITYEIDDKASLDTEALCKAGVVFHRCALEDLESGVIDGKWRLTVEQFLYDHQARSERRAARHMYKIFKAKWDSLAWFRERVAVHKTLCKRVTNATGNRPKTESVCQPSEVGQKRKGGFD